MPLHQLTSADNSACCSAADSSALLGITHFLGFGDGELRGLEGDGRRRHVQSLPTAIVPSEGYYMLCCTEQQPGAWCPR